MKIKKIKKLSGNKYKIEFQEAPAITTYDKVILENNILLKKEIDSDLYLKIQSENDYYDVYSKAVKYIVIKLRSEKEIQNYLRKYTNDENLIDKIIQQLKGEGLLNEKRYIKAYIEDKVNLTNWGPYKIQRELCNLGMDEEIIKEYLTKYEEEIFEEKIRKIIDKKVKTNKKDSNYILKQKVERELYDLGYSSELIKNSINNIKINESTILENEFLKLYKKLSKKYSDNELKYQVKNRLYQKGFASDEIHEIIEKIIK